MAFALLQPHINYVQGMNDLLSRFYVAVSQGGGGEASTAENEVNLHTPIRAE